MAHSEINFSDVSSIHDLWTLIHAENAGVLFLISAIRVYLLWIRFGVKHVYVIGFILLDDRALQAVWRSKGSDRRGSCSAFDHK
jgi:hypothetical protein